MKHCIPPVPVALLLLTTSFLFINCDDVNVKDVLDFGKWNFDRLMERSEFYHNFDPVDKNDIGTADDRDKTLDDRITLQEGFKALFEGYMEKTNFYDLRADEQDNVASILTSDIRFNAMTEVCRQFTKPSPKCDRSYPYRAFDGTCNNFEHPTWGSVLECTRRILRPQYEGVKGPRISVTGNPLPNPRFLSRKLHRNRNNPSDLLCHMNMFVGQFIDHDITKTAISTANGIDLQCCAPVDDPHPQCDPIIIDKKDSFYNQFNKTCFNFARAAPCSTCDFTQRTQMNTVTAFIDCSHVYGTSKQKSDELRAMDGTGKLKAQNSPFGELLPPNLSKRGDCGDLSKNQYCFDAGDPRVNEHSPIMSLHTVFLRYHNWLCDGLKMQNPTWDGEKLYQVARKILIAIFQHIIYREWLVWIIGMKFMKQNSLLVKEGVERTAYDPQVDPTVQTEFSTAAFRLHSIINEVVTAYDEEQGYRLLRKEFSDAVPLYQGGISNLISGIIKTKAQMQDPALVNDVTNFLYRPRKGPYGLDLAAFNIQRGRDNGLPCYRKAAEFCTGKEIKSFDDLRQLMIDENIELLQSVYEHVDDIDLWSGIQMETRVSSGIVGPTAACIIGRGFFTWKFGDRFYYEHDTPNGFTDDQLLEIKKMFLSSIFCQTTNVGQIHKFVFLCPMDINPLIDCSSLPIIDLSKWQEN